MIKLVAYMIKAGGLYDQAHWLLAQTANSLSSK